MLNRRLLRAKVMQTLYALEQSEVSNYHHAQDFIKETYAPDLNSMEVQDPKKLEGKRKLSTLIFDNLYNDKEAEDGDDVDLLRTAQHAFGLYKKQMDKDYKFFSRQMMENTEALYDQYLHILLFPIELAEYSIHEEEEQKNKLIKENIVLLNEQKFRDNIIIQSLKNHKQLQEYKTRKNLHWSFDFIKQIYKTTLRPDEEYLNYLKKKERDFEDDKNIVLHILKSIAFKGELTKAYFEEADLNWQENRSIIKSLVLKTIKSIEKDKPEEISLLDISNNWDEDKFFFQELLQLYIENDKQLEGIVSEKTKNWDIERIATIDKIIIKMATCEMMNFPSIPVKVTINEYIELSKLYSTPKSKQFVNGFLDKISADLTKAGLIRKSGRGLLDNK
ncbi:MAG TPA: transcription antitermination factor NusB [Cytophagaceae bacterium]|jgi:N utilization substance protein B